MKVEFVGQTISDSDNIAANPARLINCYRERVLGQGKTTHVLQSVLGQDLKQSLGDYPVRAMGYGNGKKWLAANGTLYEVADNGALTSKGSVDDDADTTIYGNYSDVTIASGGKYYVWDGSTVSEPTTKTFTDVGSHCYVGGYTVITEENGKRFQWSDLGDAATLDALNFSSADKVDDNILRAVEVGGNLLLMCETSAELWQVTGAAGSEAFGYVASWKTGLKDFNLLTQYGDTLFWIGHDNNAYIGVGSGAIDVTTPGLNTALENNNPTHCFYYEDRGHKFCVVRFSDRPAWVFDVKMQEWHERAEGADNGAFRATHSVLGTNWLVGNASGEVLELSRTNRDLSGPLRRTAISSPLYLGDRKFIVNMLEMNIKVGVNQLDQPMDYGLSVGGGFMLAVGGGFGLKLDSEGGSERAATVTLYESRNGGHTWGEGKVRSLGKFGEYDKRTVWRARGQANQYAVKLYIDEPADYQVNTTAVLEVI
jgi:hypothetical protein